MGHAQWYSQRQPPDGESALAALQIIRLLSTTTTAIAIVRWRDYACSILLGIYLKLHLHSRIKCLYTRNSYYYYSHI